MKKLFVMLFMILAFAGAVEAAPQLSKDKVSITVGNKKKITVTGTTKTVKWTTSNKTIATVKNGTITAKKVGKCTITAKVGKTKLPCAVTVKDVYVWITKTGKRYHSIKKCGSTKSSRKVTLAYAKRLGLTKCKNCY